MGLHLFDAVQGKGNEMHLSAPVGGGQMLHVVHQHAVGGCLESGDCSAGLVYNILRCELAMEGGNKTGL